MILFACLVGFLTSSSTTRLFRGQAPETERLSSDNLRAATHETEREDHDFCLSRLHFMILLTPTQPVGSGRPQRESNPGSSFEADSHSNVPPAIQAKCYVSNHS